VAKQYTQAAWARIQSRLPEEDRVPYAESPEKFDTPADVRARTQRFAQRIEPGVTEEEFPTSVTTPRGTTTLDSSIIESEPKRYYNYFTGEYVDDPSKIVPRAGMGGPESGGGPIQVSVDAGGEGKKETRREFLGAGASRVLRVYYDDGSFQDFPSPDTSGNGNNDGDGSDSSIFGSVTGTSTTRSLGRDQFKNSLALFFGAAEAAKPWVDALYDVVSKFYRTGSDVDQSFNLALQDARNNPALKPFTDRFKGIYALQDLKLTGKPVLVPTIAEYVVSQAKMADVLTQANLGSIATDEFTTELISKGNSVTTIADKIAKVYQRIDMAPKAIKDTLGRYFPTVDRTTLARTLLTGQKGVDQLVDELEQYEVLAAAEGQGLGAINRIGGVDLGRAQEYARSGQTFTSLTPKFSQIARALPTTTKLSQISKLEDIGQIGLEKAVISQSAKELEQLEELGEQEMARYSGKAGRAELGLASQRRANRAF
jgi:hypothetical protein